MRHGILLLHSLPITLLKLGRSPPPDGTSRPDKATLLPPRGLPRRCITAGSAWRIALLHAIAHKELNAIDLALDTACRFVGQNLPKNFKMIGLAVRMMSLGIF